MIKYNKDYFLSDCGGCEQYQQHKGKILNDILQFTINISNLLPIHKVLDIGCGRGELVFHSALKGCEVTGIDVSSDAIDISYETIAQLPEELRKHVKLTQKDACEIDFADNYFDRIFLTDVVEHLTDEELRKVFNICLRLLKDDGKVIIHTAPTLNYLKIGQHIRKLFYYLKFKAFQPTTLQYEKEKKGHVNIQSKSSLEKHLNMFPRVECWYQFCVSGNPFKMSIDRTPLAPYLALSLFAIAAKE